jgi:predicted nucleic acid-binding protein
VLPTEVLVESLNVIGKKVGTRVAVSIGERILESKALILVSATEETLNRALVKLSRMPNSVSYIDCLVMALADAYDTRAIFGFDEAFRKNGYQLPQTEKKEAA